MSGDALVLAAAPDSVTAALVRTLARLSGEGIVGLHIVGGLAVLCRVGTLFRATSDLDTILEDGGPAIAALQAHPSASPTTNGVSIDGTQVDIIPVGPLDVEQLPDDPSLRFFVLGHRYAYDTAEPVSIDVVDPLGPSTLIAHADVPMATPAALVAMKLNSYPNRRGRWIAKQGSDLQDLVALLAQYDREGAVGGTLARAPYDLGRLCADAARTLLVDDADIAAARVRRYTNTELDPEYLRRLADRFVGALATSEGGR